MRAKRNSILLISCSILLSARGLSSCADLSRLVKIPIAAQSLEIESQRRAAEKKSLQ